MASFTTREEGIVWTSGCHKQQAPVKWMDKLKDKMNGFGVERDVQSVIRRKSGLQEIWLKFLGFKHGSGSGIKIKILTDSQVVDIEKWLP